MLERHQRELDELGGEDPDFVLTDSIEWGPETNTPLDELAAKPKAEKSDDPCNCRINYDDPTELTCNDLSCVLFACQEECRSNCTCGDQCGNKRIQKRQWKELKIIEAGKKGKGLIVLEDVKKGDLIAEYVGRAINKAFLQSLFRRYATERKLYIMSLTNDIYLDARKKGGIARYINHSCDPNCVVERWKVKGLLRAAVVAQKDLPAGTELTFDYQWERKRGRAPTKCHCGSALCRGTLEVPKSMEDEELERKLSQHWKRPLIKRAGKEIVNRCVKVLSKEAQDYYTADVIQYDDKTGKHLLMFRHDLEESWEDLKAEDWMILDEEAEQFIIRKKSPTSEAPFPDAGSLLSSMGNGGPGGILMQGQTNTANYVYTPTPIKEALFAKHLIERCQRSCRVTITPHLFRLPVDLPQVDASTDAETAERIQMLQSSQDGTVWKLTIAGSDVAKARDILQKNVVYLTTRVMGDIGEKNAPDNHKSNGGQSTSDPAILSSMAVLSSDKPQIRPPPTIEIVMPRLIVDSMKRRLSVLREKFKTVSYEFVHSDSKSKQIAKLLVEGAVEQDISAARDLLWQLLNQACEELNVPKAPSGVYKDLGFLGGSMDSADFVLLSSYGKRGVLLASAYPLTSSKVEEPTVVTSTNLNQDAREDLSLQSPFFASFESAQRCNIWVQADSDKGRIDSSNRVVNEATSDGERSIYLGCAPNRVAGLWKLIETRAADIGKGVKFLYLGPTDRLYRPRLMQKGNEFFDFVRKATGASVEVDSMTSDHLRIDGGAPPTSDQAVDLTKIITPEVRAAHAEELVRLQIELYRDHSIRQEKWIFGRDWALARRVALANTVDDSSEGGLFTSSGRSVFSRSNPFEGKSLANACLEIFDMVTSLDLDKNVAAHASTILYRFGTVLSMRQSPETQFKIREVSVACVFIANKAQKKRKWKKLDAVLGAAYAVFYPGVQFDSSKEEVQVWEERVILSELEVLERLDYDVFYRGFQWMLATAVDSVGMDRRVAKECLSFSLSGPVLASGADLWLTHGPEYIFAASAAFLEADYESLSLSLSLIPIKVCRAAEIIAAAVKTTTFGRKHLSHPLFKEGRKVLESKLPAIKIKCANLMSETDEAKRQKTKLSEREMRYRLIADRHGARRTYKGVTTDTIKEHILPAIDGISAESNCNIYIDRSLPEPRKQDPVFDVMLEGSWRAVSLASHLLLGVVENSSSVMAQKSDGKHAKETVFSFRSMQAKGWPGLLQMQKIEISDGWARTIQSKDSSQAGWGRKTGGKCCVPGRIKESDLRQGGLRWWIPPRYGPSSSGSICDMLLLGNDSANLMEAIGRLSYHSQGDSTVFAMLTSVASSKDETNGSAERFVALSLSPWPSEKTAKYELGKGKKDDPGKKGKKNKRALPIGFSPAALEELQLLRELHGLIDAPQGHPNFYLPVGIGLQADQKSDSTKAISNGTKGGLDMKTIDADIFSLTRSSLENEAMAQKEEKRNAPHLVTQPMPFVLQRFVGKKKRRDDSGDEQGISPKIFACWCHDLLSALLHCHENDVVVRYFQMDQVVVDHSGVVKLGSLYRSTVLSKEDKKANILELARGRKGKSDDDDDVKDPYAPPEMLLGSPLHTKAADIWELGCLLAHLLLGKPICSAKDRESLLSGLYKFIGTPSSKHFPSAAKFPHYMKPVKKYVPDVKRAIFHMAKDRDDINDYAGAIDLISQMIQLDPEKRISAKGALQHEYMLNYMEDSSTTSFQETFVQEWIALKNRLMKSSKTEEDEILERERGEKRKAMLIAASKAMAGDEDDLYDMEDILEGDSKRTKM